MKPTYLNSPKNVAGRWMVVDDDPNLLVLLHLMLQELHGVEVECYNSPVAALVALTAAPHEYALVITDFQMPEMDGAELRHRMHALVPELKIFLATGSGLFTDYSARRLGFSGLLTKPFSLAALQNFQSVDCLALF